MFAKIKYIKNTLNWRKCYTLPEEVLSNISSEKFKNLSHGKRLDIYLNSSQHIKENKDYIPKKYLQLKRRAVAEYLYLVDSKIAADIAKHILPAVKDTDQIICETNAGLGFLTSELLNGGLEHIRLYETCPDFRLTLKEFSNIYPGKVELYIKDLFHLWKMSFIDKMYTGDRVAQYLKGVPKRNWSNDPVMTIIGIMPKLEFLSYVFKMICLEQEIAAYGRIEMFVIMRPGDYLKLTAGPHCNLHTYQVTSIFANVFCNFTLIEKYPRIAFLPWESAEHVTRPRVQSFRKHEVDKLYLVRVEFKKELPLETEHLLPFYYFVKKGFRRGTRRLIPQLEEWCDGVGVNLIIPEDSYHFNRDMDIYTRSGELTPMELLQVFKIFYDQPNFKTSNFAKIVEAELMKEQTVATYIADSQKPSTNPT